MRPSQVFLLALVALAGVLLPGLAKAQAPSAQMVIDLAPYKLLTPDQLRFGRSTYDFRLNPPRFDRIDGSGSEIVTVEKVYQNGDNDESGAYYRVTIANITKGRVGQTPVEKTKAMYHALLPFIDEARAYTPPPATNILLLRRPLNLRMTFEQPVPSARFDEVLSYVSDRGSKDNVYFGNGSCTDPNSRSYLCIKETVRVTNPDTSEITLALHQRIELQGVYVIGNVAAPQQISNIRLTPNAIAVGGQFTNVSGQVLTNYLESNPNSQIKWTNGIQSQLNSLFEKRTRGTTVGTISGGTWNLNAVGTDPGAAGESTTFTTPPEGKLWNVNGNLTLNEVLFRGSGTIVVDGDVTFNGPVNCFGEKRLGIIARGNIRFNNSHIECGAYVALNGNLTLAGEPPNTGDTARAIFIARHNISIPEATIAPYVIDYDKAFALKPTVLFKELLTIVLNTQS